MLGLAIEGLGALLAAHGTFAWFKGARSELRYVGLVPLTVYVGGQGISIAATGRDDFSSVYPWALAIMAFGGVLGIAFAIRAPTRIDSAT